MTEMIGILMILAVVGLLVYAAMQPDNFRLERSTTVKAPRNASTRTSSTSARGPPGRHGEEGPGDEAHLQRAGFGVGAAYGWEGDKNVGTGKMTITEAVAPGKVVIKLEFLKPFAATNTAEFTLQPQGDSTAITWAMYGKSNFLSKVMCVFMSMDKMVGPDFEAGLAGLKAVAEKPAG